MRATWVLTIFLLFVLGPPLAEAQPKKDVVAEKLRSLQMDTHKAQGKMNMFRARKLAEKWVAYARKQRGAGHRDTISARQSLAGLYSSTGASKKAERIYRETLQSAIATHGPESQEAALAIDALAGTLWGQQRLDDVEKLYVRSLKIYRKLYGESPNFAGMLSRQAGLLQQRYMFGAAEAIYYEQIRIYRKTEKGGVAELGVYLSLGMLYGRLGDIKRAKRSFDKLLKGYEKKFGKNDTTRLPTMMQSIAMMYANWGKPKLASALYERTEKAFRLELKQQTAKPKQYPGQLTGIKNQLAMVLHRQGKLDEARQHYERLTTELEKQHGKDTFQASLGYYPLSEIYRAKGQTAKARKMLKKWARSYRKGFGGFATVTPLIFLADLERVAGNHKRARKLANKIRAAAVKHWGKNHPYTQNYSEVAAFSEIALGAPKRALKLLENSYAIDKKAIALQLATGTEQDNRTYLNERRHHLHTAVSLHSQYLQKNARAIRLGLDTALVHKGRLLDASAAGVASLRKRLSKKDQALLDELAAARSELAQLVVAGPAAMGGNDEEYGREIARLERLVRRREGKVRSASAVFRASDQAIEIASVQKVIPRSAVLVEIVSYRKINPSGRTVVPRTGNRYGAYILLRSGEPKFVDLGPAKRIDKAVGNLRRELSTAKGTKYERYGKQLYNLVFAKIEPLLGKRKLVLLAPDGSLNLLPFAALIDGRGNYLVQRYNFSYLSSGRDLLRLSVEVKSKGGVLIFADPSFDDSGKTSKGGTRGLTSRALRSVKWKKLPGTAKEAAAIVKMLKGASLLSGKKATESRLKKVKAPRILHLATHGFFLPGEKEEDEADVAKAPPTAMMPAATKSPGSGQDNPLLRSGLAFAGANKLKSGTDDGVLTALEASGLDLWGTKLVVLSACETGVGEIAEGEGVYGLRRALVMAGAESMLMSLWQVDDAGTKELMTGYYKRLSGGAGRAASLRLIQLRMLRSEKHQHPYYWASFIPSGAWSPMNKDK